MREPIWEGNVKGVKRDEGEHFDSLLLRLWERRDGRRGRAFRLAVVAPWER